MGERICRARLFETTGCHDGKHVERLAGWAGGVRELEPLLVGNTEGCRPARGSMEPAAARYIDQQRRSEQLGLVRSISGIGRHFCTEGADRTLGRRSKRADARMVGFLRN